MATSDPGIPAPFQNMSLPTIFGFPAQFLHFDSHISGSSVSYLALSDYTNHIVSPGVEDADGLRKIIASDDEEEEEKKDEEEEEEEDQVPVF